jgi:tyrosine kinase 2
MDRNDLQFTLSFGNGWFGWIVQGVYRKQFDADGDVGLGEDVVVQILKEEATMEEEIGFREISTASRLAEGHTNVLKLVGSCFDAIPRLHVYEYCQMGDLKTFMVDNKGRIMIFLRRRLR